MLLVLQFPICDGRPFTSEAARLAVPHWLDPLPGEFVRAFGPILRRRRAGPDDGIDELYYASARQALKLADLGPRDDHRSLACAFRRLQSDGGALARIEVGFRPSRTTPAAAAGRVDSAVARLLDLPVRVPALNASPTAVALHAAGPSLARLFARATTRTSQPVAQHLVRAMAPALLVEYDDHEAAALPGDAEVLDPALTGGVPLAYVRREHGDQALVVWLLGPSPSGDAATRAVRVALLRVHAEQQALRHVVTLLLDGTITFSRGTPHGERLEAYLNRAASMSPESYPGAPAGKTIANILHAYSEPIPAAQRSRLAETLAQVKRQIAAKVDRYLTAGEQARVNTTAPADRPIRVVVSYSHHDEEFVALSSRKSLLKFLVGLEREGFVFWHDRDLYASEIWDDRIRSEFSRADIALVLVSQYFLNSRYITDTEMPTLLDARRTNGLSIVPLLVAPSDWQTHAWLSGTQWLPRSGTLVREYRTRARRDELYLEVFHTLRRLGTAKRLAAT